MNALRNLAAIVVALAIAIPAAADTIPARDAYRLFDGILTRELNSIYVRVPGETVRYDGTSLVISEEATYSYLPAGGTEELEFLADLSIALLVDDSGIVADGAAIWTKDDGTLLLLAEVYAVGWEFVFPSGIFSHLQIEARTLFAGGEAAGIGPRVGFFYQFERFLSDLNNPWAAPWSCRSAASDPCGDHRSSFIFSLPVPEPGTLALLTLGLLGIGLTRKR